jgi:parallel beta-helix repeat protein
MISKKCKLILIFSIVFFGLNASFISEKSTEVPNGAPIISDPSIYIDSDSDFISLGFDGNGDSSNPYLIQDLVIDVSGSDNGIFISGTTKYFIIQNCSIATEYIWIRVDDVSAGTAIIRNNTCISKNNDGGGIGVAGTDVMVVNNTCIGFIQGIHTNQASEIHIINNTILDSAWQGINIRYTSNSEIIGNTIKFSEEHAIAIVKSSSSGNVVYSNNIIENTETNSYIIDGVSMGRPSSQGYDEGVNNYWYNVPTQIGNYWSDCSGSGVYSIDGSSGSMDEFPINCGDSRAIPGFIGILLISVMCILGLSYFIKRNKNK